MQAKKIALRLIHFYQYYISILTPPQCRYIPSCSEYTAIAIENYGVLRGCAFGAKRLCRCHPFCAGGMDPVPLNNGNVE